MKKPTGKLAVTAGAVTSALVLTAAPASAAPSTVWTVGPSPVGVSLSNGANIVMSVNGIAWTCTKSTATAALRSATGNPATVGTVGSLSFAAAGAPCSSVLGNITLVPATPWTFVAQDHTAATGVTKGHLGDVDMKLTVGATVFRVRGKASATYTNATGKLSVDSFAGELPIVESLNGGSAFPVGAGLLLKADYLVKKTGTTVVPTIVGSQP
ncbi:hypothetical protein [Streptomyces sp. NPDC093071]|uniref:hypothetical protein n=1 Tax=Streptomyces sp. NPDC093071 TaxID=3366022 RepID=UPI00380BBB16